MTAKLLLFVAICVLGSSSAMWYEMYSRLRKVGINIVMKDQVLPHYLRNRKKHGWPVWPAYLQWPLFIAGVVLFIMGVVRL